MVKPEKFGHLHLVYHFTVPLMLSMEYDRYIFLKYLVTMDFDQNTRYFESNIS